VNDLPWLVWIGLALALAWLAHRFDWLPFGEDCSAVEQILERVAPHDVKREPSYDVRLVRFSDDDASDPAPALRTPAESVRPT
jgi:hypothetical protein